MANEDVVWVDVLPSLSGFTSALRKGLSGVGVESSSIGRAAGASFGSGFSSGAESGLQAAQSRVEQVEKRLADAKGSLAVAQTRLTEAQNKGTTSAGTLAAAQERVEKAARNVNLQQTSLVRANQDLAVAQKSVTDTSSRQTQAIVAQNKETEKAPGLIEKFSSGWIKTAAIMGTVTYAAYGIKQAFGALYSTIDVASGLNEEINKSRVVFGNASQSVIDFAQNAARGMGESRLEALQSTGIFGNLFRAVGLTTDQSAVMSTQLVKLASDLASFNNADPSEVLLAMRAGLVGESEPMRRFGVDLSDLALRQEAANLKIYDGTGVLNQSQKAQAAYSLLLKQTTLAQGDFVRTSAGLANSTRILKGEWIDLEGALGGLLLGPATGVVHWLNDLLPRMQTGIEGLHKFGQAFTAGFTEASGAVRTTGISGVFEALGQQVRNTTDFLSTLAHEVSGALRAGFQAAAPEVAALSSVFSNLVPTLQVVASHWHDLIIDVVDAFLPVIRQLVPLVASVATALGTVLGSALQATIPILSVLADAASQVAQVLADALLGVIRQIAPILPSLTSAFSEVANTLGRGLLTVVRDLSPVMSTWAQVLGQVAQTLAGTFLSVIRALEPVLPVIATAFANIATTVAGAFAQALNAVAPILPVLAKALSDIATTVAGALAQAIGKLAPVLPPLVDAFVQLLQSAIQPLLPLLPTLARILGDVVGAITPLIPAAADVLGAFAHMATGVLPALTPPLQAIATVIQVLARAFEALPGPVQTIVGIFLVLKSTLGVNIFSATITGLSGLGSAFQSTMPRITGVTTGMVTAVKAELAELTASFATAKLAQQELVASNFGIGSAAVPRAIGDLKGLEAAAGRVATQGFGLIKTAGAGLLSFFGGPWGLAIAGVGIGLTALISWLSQESEATKKAKAATDEWKSALESANGVINESTRQAAALALEHAGVLETAQRLGIALPTVVDAVTGEGDAFDQVKQKLRDYIDQHSTAEGRSAQFGRSLDDEGQAAQDALNALEGLNSTTGSTETSQGRVAEATRTATQAQRDQTQALKDYIDTQLGATDAVLGYQSSLLNAQSSINQYNQSVAAGTLSGLDRAQAENSIAQSITAATEAAGRAAAAQLGPNADASAKATAAATAQKAAFEALVGQLGYIPPSLQSVADTLGVTDASLQASKSGAVDPLAKAWGDLALSTVKGIVLPIFGQIPDAMKPANDALNAQALGVLPTNAAAWVVWANGVVTDILGAFGLGGSIPNALGQTDGALSGQAAPGGPLHANEDAWHDYLSGIPGFAQGAFGAGGTVPGALDTTNAALYFQASPGGPLVLNQTAWHNFLQSTLGPIVGAFGAGGSVPGALSNTDGALYSQAGPNGPLVLNQAAWHTYVAGITDDILGLFGFGGTGGTLPGSLQNSGIQLNAFRTDAVNNLGIVNAAFINSAATATTSMNLIADHVHGPMTAAMVDLANATVSSTDVVNAAFTTMQQTTTARMTDVENHIYGPMTTALASFSTQSINNTNVIDASFTTMQQTTSARMVDVENHIYGPMSSALVSLSNNTASMSGQVQNSFIQMAAGAINASSLAANGVGAAFDRIRAGVGNPVNFVVSRVIGGALIPAFNNVASAIGIGGIAVGLPTVALAEGGQVPGFADGGQIGGPYIGPKADNVPGYIAFSNGGVAPIRVNPREFIQPVSSVDKYGVGFMEAVRTGAFPTAIARAFAEGGHIPGFAQGGMTYPTLEGWVHSNLPGAIITSAYRPGAKDYHGAGDAVDISYPGNPQSRNMPAAAKIAASFGGITELIHNPNESIKNGRVVPPSFWGAATWAQHANHVHWAMTPSALAGGGAIVGGGAPVGISINGQLITSSGQVASLLNNSIAGPLAQLSQSFGSTQLTRYLGDFTHSLTNRAFGAIRGRIDSAIAATAASALGGAASGPVKDIVASVFASRGWGSGAQWAAVDQIVSHESSWNPGAQNPSSTASGLFQEIDGTWRAYRRPSASGYSKMRLAPVNEQGWGGLNYIAARYGSPAAAWSFWQAHRYYDDGGLLGDGMTGANASGFDERVLSPRQTVAFERLVNAIDRGDTATLAGPQQMTGELYLDSGEFMGHVHGTVNAVLDRRDGIDARNLRSS